MKRWKLWLGVVVIFLSGVVVGALGTGMFVKHKIGMLRKGPRFVMEKLVLKKFTRELDLDAEQQQKIEQILNQTADELLVLHRQTFPEVRAILGRAVSHMKEHLSLEQQKKLDEIVEKAKSRRGRLFREGSTLERASPYRVSEMKN
jgi:hypothetical protein